MSFVKLNSKISIISKTEIRYEGRLGSVDSVRNGVLLSNVKSFGTENRKVECRVPPQNKVFKYIYFDECDIKEFRVLNNGEGPSANCKANLHLASPSTGRN